MISIPIYQKVEADRMAGDPLLINKVAFNVSVDPASVMGSLAGGYVANRVYNKKKDQYHQSQEKQRTIENDAYTQVQSVLQDLRIVFTPINVVYKVNGQVFEIIQADEMTPYMKQAFVQKDGDYFRNLLVNKINMEIQLAEKAFAQRLIAANGYGGQMKEATYIAKQEFLLKNTGEAMDELVKTASVGLPEKPLEIEVSFTSLRPFMQTDFFDQPNVFQKVANVFGVFDDDPQEDVGVHRFNHEVNVGFLPDRVVFLWNGQMIEQMSLLHMNEEGYEAFRKRDKQFFIDLFKEHTQETAARIQQEVQSPPVAEEQEGMEQQASIDFSKPIGTHVASSGNLRGELNVEEFDKKASADEKDWWNFYQEQKDDGDTDESIYEEAVEHFDLDAGEEMHLRSFYKGKGVNIQDHFWVNKEASALEDIIEDLTEEEFPVMERDQIDVFEDADIHPIVYDKVLASRYGAKWAQYETEAILKQIEEDFKLADGIAENPINKISILRAIAAPEHAMYQSPLTFEKFVRGMNSKSIRFEEFQGNLSFEEILFALEVAKAYDGEEVFLEFHDNIAPYLSEELMNQGIRVVSKQVFDEANATEKEFYERVNSFLMRKWKEEDSRGLLDDSEIDAQNIMTEQIVEAADDVLTLYAELIEVEDPYTSVARIIDEYGLLDAAPAENRTGMKNMVKETVVNHLLAAIFVAYKHDEFDYLVTKLKEEGVIHDRN